MALRNDTRDLIAERLGFFTSAQNDRIVKQMVVVQSSVLEDGRLTPWFLRSLDQDLTVTAGSRTVALPSDFIVMDDEAGVWHYDSSEDPAYVRKLVKDSWKILIQTYGEDASDDPKRYDLDKENLYIFPKADEDDISLKISYYARETSLADSDITNAWLEHAQDLFIAETVLRMARVIRDKDAIAMAKEDIVEARHRLLVQHVEREMNDNDRQMGGDD